MVILNGRWARLVPQLARWFSFEQLHRCNVVPELRARLPISFSTWFFHTALLSPTYVSLSSRFGSGFFGLSLPLRAWSVIFAHLPSRALPRPVFYWQVQGFLCACGAQLLMTKLRLSVYKCVCFPLLFFSSVLRPPWSMSIVYLFFFCLFLHPVSSLESPRIFNCPENEYIFCSSFFWYNVLTLNYEHVLNYLFVGCLSQMRALHCWAVPSLGRPVVTYLEILISSPAILKWIKWCHQCFWLLSSI